ncbi:hypothetical protein C8R45DRAFT_945149 [Mycena sanguinolenta]|nr:hypothetical protein C8R45DRAFT_945149 [Mycena sanguinolenta]
MLWHSIKESQRRHVPRRIWPSTLISAALCADQLAMHLLARDGSTRADEHRGGARTERECGEDEGEMREREELHSPFTQSDLDWDERCVPGWSAQSALYLVGRVVVPTSGNIQLTVPSTFVVLPVRNSATTACATRDRGERLKGLAGGPRTDGRDRTGGRAP